MTVVHIFTEKQLTDSETEQIHGLFEENRELEKGAISNIQASAAHQSMCDEYMKLNQKFYRSKEEGLRAKYLLEQITISQKRIRKPFQHQIAINMNKIADITGNDSYRCGHELSRFE